MSDTRIAKSGNLIGTASSTNANLKWLLAANALQSENSAINRARFAKEQALMMKSPVNARSAFGFYGLFLGVFPPAAIFSRVLTPFGPYPSPFTSSPNFFLIIAVAMIVVSAVVGRRMGSYVGSSIVDVESLSWWRAIPTALMIGILWGIATGGASGALFFGIGSVFGAVCAAMVGAVAFPVFIVLHKLLAQGGMIEKGVLLPVSIGVSAFIAALILGL
jgi:hypothetical protein